MNRKTFNVLGLLCGIIGVIIIFCYGPPQPNFEKGIAIGLEAQQATQHDAQVSALRDKYETWSRTGLSFILIGFVFQFVAEMLTEAEIGQLHQEREQDNSQPQEPISTPSPHQELLLAVYEGQRAESLQHRQTIFNSFSLSMAGLLAIAAGVVAPGHLSCELKVIIAVVVLFVVISITYFICTQRAKSEEAMKIMRELEKHFRLFDKGTIIEGKQILPDKYKQSPHGVPVADLVHIFSLAGVCVGIWFLLLFSPTADTALGPTATVSSVSTNK